MTHLIKCALSVNIAHTLSDIYPQINHFLLYFPVIYAKMGSIVKDLGKRILYQQLVIKAYATNGKPLRKPNRYLLP